MILQAYGPFFAAQNGVGTIILAVKAKCADFGMVFVKQHRYHAPFICIIAAEGRSDKRKIIDREER